MTGNLGLRAAQQPDEIAHAKLAGREQVQDTESRAVCKSPKKAVQGWFCGNCFHIRLCEYRCLDALSQKKSRNGGSRSIRGSGRIFRPLFGIAKFLDLLAVEGFPPIHSQAGSRGALPGSWAGQISFPEWPGSTLQRAGFVNAADSFRMDDLVFAAAHVGRDFLDEYAIVSAVAGVPDFLEGELATDFAAIFANEFFA